MCHTYKLRSFFSYLTKTPNLNLDNTPPSVPPILKKIDCSDTWCESWKISYSYDLLELYGENISKGYAYAYNNRRKHTLELIQRVARPGMKILDVAAAQGNFSLLLAEMGYEVTWNDLREDLIGYVELKYERGIIHYAPGNILELDFDSCFDIVLIAEVIEHVAHPDEFLKNIARMIKPDGYIVMTTPNGGYFMNKLPKFSGCPDPSRFESVQFKPNSDGHIFLLHVNEVMMLAHAAGLTPKELRLFTNPLTNGHIKLGALLGILPSSLVQGCEWLTSRLPFRVRKKLNTGMACLLARTN